MSATGERSLGRGGFSLIELLVVLAIMALLAAVLLPGGVRSNGAELRSMAGDIRSLLLGTRIAAMRSGEPRSVEVDLDRRVLGFGGKTVALPEDVDLSLYTATSEVVGARVAGIRFHADGTSTGGHIEIHRQGRAFRIGIDWLTGAVRIDDQT
jgi:general secretion pathway protein H